MHTTNMTKLGISTLPHFYSGHRQTLWLILVGLLTLNTKAAAQQTNTLVGSTAIKSSLQLFTNPSYTREYHPSAVLSTGDFVYAQISTDLDPDGQIKVVLNQCWAIPSISGNAATKIFLIKSPGCPGSRIQTSVVTSGETTFARFRFRVFLFSHSSTVTLHCSLNLCVGDCVPNCSSRRKRELPSAFEAGSTIFRMFAEAPPPPVHHLQTPSNNASVSTRTILNTTSGARGEKNNQKKSKTLYIVIAALAGWLLSCIIVAAVVLSQRMRRKRKEDMKRSDKQTLYAVIT